MHLLVAALPALLASGVHVGVCREKEDALYPRGATARIELLVEVENGVAHEVDVGHVGSPSRVVAALSRTRWFALDEDGVAAIAGPFADARVVYSWNETDDGDTEPPGIGDDSAKLVLGACDQPGTLYATEALAMPRRDDSSGDATWSRSAETASYSPEIRDSYPADMLREMPASWELHVFTLRHPMLEKPVHIGGVRGDTSVNVTLARVVVLPGGHLLAVVITNASSIESSEAVEADVLVLREDGVSRVPISLQGWGC
jgi:hypothetical protein